MHSLSHAADYIQDLSFLGEEDEEEAAPRRTKKRGKGDGACWVHSHTLSTTCTVWGPAHAAARIARQPVHLAGARSTAMVSSAALTLTPAFSPAADEDYEAPDGEGSEDFDPGECAAYLYGSGSGERCTQLALLLCVCLGTC